MDEAKLICPSREIGLHVPRVGIFQKIHFKGDDSSLYRGYRCQIGAKMEKMRAAPNKAPFRSSCVGVVRIMNETSVNMPSAILVWLGSRHS